MDAPRGVQRPETSKQEPGEGSRSQNIQMDSGWTLGLGLGERPEKGQMGLEMIGKRAAGS